MCNITTNLENCQKPMRFPHLVFINNGIEQLYPDLQHVDAMVHWYQKKILDNKVHSEL
jgi:hypothetical protein